MSDDDTIGPLPSEMTANDEKDEANIDCVRAKKRQALAGDNDEVVGPLPTEMEHETPDNMHPPPSKKHKKSWCITLFRIYIL